MRACSLFLLCFLLVLPGRGATWRRATSAHFNVYTSESSADTTAAIEFLEESRAFLLAATHTHDPARPLRIVAFHSAGEYADYRPAGLEPEKAYVDSRGAAIVIASAGLKPDTFESLFGAYAQLVLDDSLPKLPGWFRTGLANVYSTLKPTAGGMVVGLAPRRSFDRADIAEAKFPMLFAADRAAILRSAGLSLLDVRTSRVDQRHSVPGAMRIPRSNLLGASWALVHMAMFEKGYSAKFSEFAGLLAGGMESSAALEKAFGRPLEEIHDDMVHFVEQDRVVAVTVPFSPAKLPTPAVGPVAPDEIEKILAALKL